ncbi:MAG: WG repeat-containing protein [Rikenellaceae bacterium]
MRFNISSVVALALAFFTGATTLYAQSDAVTRFHGEQYGVIEEDGKCGVVDIYDNTYISCSYSHIRIVGDRAIVSTAAGERVVDMNNRAIVEPYYQEIEILESGHIVAYGDMGDTYIYNEDGTLFREVESGVESLGSEFSNGYLMIRRDGKYGFLGSDGQIAIPIEWDAVSTECDTGLFCVKRGGKWGYIDVDSNVVIDFKYDKAHGFINGYAEVMLGDISRKVGSVIPTLSGVINTKGEEVMPVKYEQLKPHSKSFFSSDLFPVVLSEGDDWVAIDSHGVIKTSSYDLFEPFNDGVAIVGRAAPSAKGGYLYGMVGPNGDEVIEPLFDEISEMYDGVCIARFGKDYYAVSPSGQLYPQYFDDWSHGADEGFVNVSMGGEWYSIDSSYFAGLESYGSPQTTYVIRGTVARDKRNVSYSDIWIEHNLLDGDDLGMSVHMELTLLNLKGKTLNVTLTFVNEDGDLIVDKDGEYCNAEGSVEGREDVVVNYDRSQYDDFQIFIPYKEMHLENGDHDLQLRLSTVDGDKEWVKSAAFTFSMMDSIPE